MNYRTKISTIVVCVCLVSAITEAKTIRATEMGAQEWSRFDKGTGDLIVEFREGDQLPATVGFQGDFLETAQQGTSYVNVKRSFWVKLQSGSFQMSLDG